MKNTLLRSVTGLIYLVIFIGSLLAGPLSFSILFFAICLIALFEFYRIIRLMGYKSFPIAGMIAGSTLFITTFLHFYFDLPGSFIALPFVFIVYVYIVTVYSKSKNALHDMVFTIFGIIYIVIPLSLFNYFAFSGEGYTYRIILGFFILLWTNDTFAYIFGVTMGRHKLLEKISPKKSWEGFIGGTVFTILLAFFMADIMKILSPADWIVIGVIISSAGVYGDLFESMFKRMVDIKDSGKLLPGHGGMLDRIDSTLLSSPLVFLYLILFVR